MFVLIRSVRLLKTVRFTKKLSCDDTSTNIKKREAIYFLLQSIYFFGRKIFQWKTPLLDMFVSLIGQSVSMKGFTCARELFRLIIMSSFLLKNLEIVLFIFIRGNTVKVIALESSFIFCGPYGERSGDSHQLVFTLIGGVCSQR